MSTDDPTVIERLSEALAGRYRVEREIGAGGMATVYLAHDERHDRSVAIKVLRSDLAAVMGADRFLSEIRTTANLQHPHILPLFDSGEADGFLFYVMPYVEGESLRARIDREKHLSVDEAVRIARAIAAALDYAHRHDVIHRDVKPENVLLHDGEPLVADFGIALAVSQAGGGRLTETGLSLGTPYYMSPEQATADRDPGPASDVYSLGCVLYEMLVGDPPHTGSSAQAVLAKILTEEPRSITDLRRTVPANVAAAVTCSLERLPADRFAGAGDFSRALEDPGFTHATAARSAEVASSATRGAEGAGAGRWKLALAFGLPALAAGVALGYALKPIPRVADQEAVRFTITGDSLHSLATICCGASMALSPDGTLLTYQGLSEGVLSLWARPLAETTARRLSGGQNPSNVFFSADGDWIGYLDAPGSALMKISIAGGVPATILDDIASFGGATWLPDNTVVYSLGQTGDGLMRVSAEGGEPQPVTATDEAALEAVHAYPHALPGGVGLLFQVVSAGVSDRFIDYVDLDTGERRRVARGTYPQYVGSEESGHVLYVASNQTVMAQAFDPRSGDTSGEPFQVEDRIVLRPDGLGEYAVSRTGTIIARRGEGVALTLTLVDRAGSGRALGPVGDLRAPRFSPDGSRAAYERQGDLTGTEDEIWILGINPALPEQRLTFEGDNSFPAWRPDGLAVLFARNVAVESLSGVFERRADFSGTAERVSLRAPWEARYSPDGEWIVGSEALGAQNIWVRDVATGEEVSFLSSAFAVSTPSVSPDGNWITYVSSESGPMEIYVQPFPSGGARHLVSTAGGFEPLWSADGRELLYRSADGIVSVPLTPGEEWRPGTPRVLFEDPYEIVAQALNWDISPDGQSFLMVDGGGTSQQITVTVNGVRPPS